MKKFTLTMMMFVGLLASCSTDDVTVVNEDESNVEVLNDDVQVLSDNDDELPNDDEQPGENDVEPQPGQPSGICADATALNGSATLSAYTGPQVTFSWDNTVEHATDKTYVSYIEISEDPACPAPVYGAAVAATYPIDVFNTSSLVLPAGVSAKCFNWRIVINGYTGITLDCTTTTEWMGATYVQ